MFWKKKPAVTDPKFGVLTFSRGEWSSGDLATAAGVLSINVDGDKFGPVPQALEYAYGAYDDLTRIIKLAMTFIEGDARAMEFNAQGGALEVFSVSFRRAPGEFSVDFGLSKWPDAMINVQFKGGVPNEVWLGD